MAIGKNVKMLREARGLTLDAVAKAVGTDAQAISQMEKRDSKTSAFAVPLSNFFQVDLAALMSDDFQAHMDLAMVEKRHEPASAKLQWVNEKEAELLSNYRACGPTEQSTIDSIAKSLPKAQWNEFGVNKP